MTDIKTIFNSWLNVKHEGHRTRGKPINNTCYSFILMNNDGECLNNT